MRFTTQGDFWLVEHISGPRHNALLVSLVATNQTATSKIVPIIEALPAKSAHKLQHTELIQDAILREVIAGIDDGNLQLGVDYAVREIRYFADDSGPETVYRYMAFGLIEHIVNAAGKELS